MNNWKITRIYLHNFKGFAAKEILFDESIQANILGGKNGFGKTTIFDAIELVLTGTIKRYQNYSADYVNHKYKKDSEDLPLVFDKQLQKVQIDLEISCLQEGEIQHYILYRMSDTASLKNPIDFSVFSKLYIRDIDATDEIKKEVDDAMKRRLGIEDLCRYYQSIHYLSQEEAVSFLKQKETDRAGMINTLFDTAYFDDKIRHISKVLNDLSKEKISPAKSELDLLTNNLQILLKSQVKESASQSTIPYRRLFDIMPIDWDQENPSLSWDGFTEVLKEGGVMDNLIYLCQHEMDFFQWKKNRYVQVIESKIEDLVFYVYYSSQNEDIQLFQRFIKAVHEFERLSLPQITSYKLSPDLVNTTWVPVKIIQEVANKLLILQQRYLNESGAKKVLSEMIAHRLRLASALYKIAVQMDIKTCPLCGHSYDSVQDLLKRLKQTEESQKVLLDGLKNESVQAFQDFIQYVQREIIQVVLSEFSKRHVTNEVTSRFMAISSEKMNNMIAWIQKYGNAPVHGGSTLGETEDMIRHAISRIKGECNTQLDYTRMNETFQQYYRHIPKENRQLSLLQEKRGYLLQAQLHLRQSLTSSWNQQIELLRKKLNNYQILDKKLKAFRDSVKTQKQTYLNQIINDIEILFYIYSGRIMQDCYFGRGLFMKNTDSKYVLFVSQYQSDVDALFNMSSGQLVVVALAFLMALNKLYAKVKFLAIDDPIQTIDDMNLWGFIETLRHEFKDTTLLMSTHEPDYGGLLRYKLSKMQIPAKYVDMHLIRK